MISGRDRDRRFQIPVGGSLQGLGGGALRGPRAGDNGPAGGRPRTAWLLRVTQLGTTSCAGRQAPGRTGRRQTSSRNGRLAHAVLGDVASRGASPNPAMLRRRSRPQGARVRVPGVASGAGPSHGDGGPAPGPPISAPGPARPDRSARVVKGIAVSVLFQVGAGTRVTPAPREALRGACRLGATGC
jgi:hypothetical protein